MKYFITLFFTIYCLLNINGCQSKLLTVYKIDIQQGNSIKAEEVNKVKLGMNREEVQFILGSPLVVDSFHPDRWDYIYLFTPGYGEQERRHLTLIFDRNEVIEIIKDNIVEEETIVTSQSEDDKSQLESETTDKEKEEQEKLEEQAKELEEILDKNDPTELSE